MARRRSKKSDPVSIIITVLFVLALAKCVTGRSSRSARNAVISETAISPSPTTRPTNTPFPTITPRPTWTPYPTRTQSAECQSPSCGCVIKGNINSDGKKIYHCPNSPNYDEVRINKTGERYFCTEADALAAGFTRSENTSYCGGLENK